LGSRKKRTVSQANADSKRNKKTERGSEKSEERKKIEYDTLMAILLVTAWKGTQHQLFG
jgi:hypothetical protein